MIKIKIHIVIILFPILVIACSGNVNKQFQHDADLIRLEHLEYWTELLNEYYMVQGNYPFQAETLGTEDIVLVKIATKQQLQYLTHGGSHYNKKLDNNYDGRFKEYPVNEFIIKMESVLDKELEVKYDIQKVPTTSPVGYYYFTTKDGYLIWVTCITCGVTNVSKLLLDGHTPTVNIISSGMVGKVFKALTREEMLNHPVYKSWVSKPYHNEGYVRKIESENSNVSE